MQSQIARRADIHRRTFAHRFHTAQHFDRVGVIVVLAATISSDWGNNAVFCLGFYDGSVDLFGGHTAPRESAPEFLYRTEPGATRNFPSGLPGLRPRIDFKLLKCLILRFEGDCCDYTMEARCFRASRGPESGQ